MRPTQPLRNEHEILRVKVALLCAALPCVFTSPRRVQRVLTILIDHLHVHLEHEASLVASAR